MTVIVCTMLRTVSFLMEGGRGRRGGGGGRGGRGGGGGWENGITCSIIYFRRRVLGVAGPHAPRADGRALARGRISSVYRLPPSLSGQKFVFGRKVEVFNKNVSVKKSSFKTQI